MNKIKPLYYYLYWPTSLILRALDHPAKSYSGVRRIIQDFHWKVDWDKYPIFEYADLGYSPAKFKQLLRNYYNEEEFTRVKEVLAKRAKKSGLTSVSLYLRGKPKDSRSMGHCMLTMTISKFGRNPPVVDMNYRSTELTFKFGADLVFIRWIFEQLGIKPTEVRFHWCNAFVSGGYWGTLLRFVEDPVDFLEDLKEADPVFFAKGTRVLLRSVLEKNQTWKYSPHGQQHRQLWKFFKPSVLKEVEIYLKKQGIKAEVAVDDDENEEED